MGKAYKGIVIFLGTLAVVLATLCIGIVLYDISEEGTLQIGYEQQQSTQEAKIKIINPILTGEEKSNWEEAEEEEKQDKVADLDEKEPVQGICYELFDLKHGMTFHEAMNIILSKAGISEDITTYDDYPVYYGVSYNSSTLTSPYGAYDNVEISSNMGEFFFGGNAGRMYLRFDRPVCKSDAEVNIKEPWDAELIEIRFLFKNVEETESIDETMKDYIASTLGTPEKELMERAGLCYFTWQVGNDELTLLYKEGYDGWYCAYVSLNHKKEE